jgi:large subunit ribosomal protein L25
MRVPADAIPDVMSVDLGSLDFHDSVHIASMKLPEGCRPLLHERDFTIVTITAPPKSKEEAAPAAAAAAPAAKAAAAKK